MYNRDDSFIVMVEKIAEVQRSLLWNIAKNNKLSPIQIQIIMFLDGREAVDTSLKKIANYFNLSAPTISGSVRSLLDKGYLYLHDCRKDRRIHCYKLTPSGKKMVCELEKWKDPLLGLFNSFSENEKIIIEKNLSKLVFQLKEKNLINGLQYCRECRHFSEAKPIQCLLRKITFSNNLLPVNCMEFEEIQAS